MKELIETLAKHLVDHPDQVRVNSIEGLEATVLELQVAPSDLGKVIGKRGRIAQALRTIMISVGSKQRRRYTLEILNQ